MLLENKSIRKSYEDYFADKFRPCSIKRFKLQNLSVVALNMTSMWYLYIPVSNNQNIIVTFVHT